jgi:hypothetical protein
MLSSAVPESAKSATSAWRHWACKSDDYVAKEHKKVYEVMHWKSCTLWLMSGYSFESEPSKSISSWGDIMRNESYDSKE